MRSGFRSTLRNRFFQRLWLAQVISQTVQNATNYGSIVLLAQVSHSSTAVGGVIIAFSLPAVLFGVPAGVLVDRMDKRLILWVSNGLRALASFGFVASILSDSHNYLLIYLLTFFISVIGQFFGPAEGAAIITVPVPQIEISATGIRKRVAQHLPIRYLVTDAVRTYIETHGLYREWPATPEEGGAA